MTNINSSTSRAGTKIFIVHGRDDLAKEQVARFVEQNGLMAVVLHERTGASRTLIEKIERESADAAFAVVILSSDDVGSLKESSSGPQGRARQNVVFEMGYFFGLLGRLRVCVLMKGEVERPTDIEGITYTEMDTHGAWKAKLLAEFKDSNLAVRQAV